MTKAHKNLKWESTFISNHSFMVA